MADKRESLADYISRGMMNDPTLNDDTRQKIEEWKALGNSISSLFNYFNKKSKTHNEINTVAAQRLVDSLRQRLTDISSSDPNYDAAKKNYDEAVLNLEKAKNFEKAKSIVLDAEHAVSNLAKEKSSNLIVTIKVINKMILPKLISVFRPEALPFLFHFQNYDLKWVLTRRQRCSSLAGWINWPRIASPRLQLGSRSLPFSTSRSGFSITDLRCHG